LHPDEKARGDQRIKRRFVEMLGHGNGEQRHRERNTDRRVMSRNSGLAVSPAAGVISSSAMPQIGQLPGSLRMICGCIGQVHNTSPAAAMIGPRGCSDAIM